MNKYTDNSPKRKFVFNHNNSKSREKIMLLSTIIINSIYGIFNIYLGYYYSTYWFLSLGCYYISLVVIRLIIFSHTNKYSPGEKIKSELIKYRFCGIAFLIMNSILSLIIFFMVYWDRTFYHNEITTITIATYTFTSLTISIINAIKHRKHRSPILSASKTISLAAACVSVLTLESTMLTTFGSEQLSLYTRRVMLASSGFVLSAFIISLAIYMIINSTRQLKAYKKQSRK